MQNEKNEKEEDGAIACMEWLIALLKHMKMSPAVS